MPNGRDRNTKRTRAAVHTHADLQLLRSGPVQPDASRRSKTDRVHDAPLPTSVSASQTTSFASTATSVSSALPPTFRPLESRSLARQRAGSQCQPRRNGRRRSRKQRQAGRALHQPICYQWKSSRSTPSQPWRYAERVSLRRRRVLPSKLQPRKLCEQLWVEAIVLHVCARHTVGRDENEAG